MNRKLLYFLLLLFVALGIFGATKWYWSSPRPNVVLVTFDTTRADHLGVYGYREGLTESFDEFARRGVVFDRAYSPVPVTLPSHATMLTGLYPPEHGLKVNGYGKLGSQIPFLPEILKQQGYETGAFIASAVLDSQYGLDRGFDVYDDQMPAKATRSELSEPRRDGQDVVTSAIEWLRKRTSRPFFCWIHLYDAHGPYHPRSEYFADKFLQQPYDAGIAWQTRQFGRITDFLTESKLDSRTLVVVAGDHGEGLHEHQETDHGMLVYNTTLQVPLVFVYPPICRPNIHVKDVVSLVDITPTVLDLLRIPAPKHTSGRSLQAAFQAQTIGSRDCYAETDTPFTLNHWSPQRSIITDRWKYIKTTRPELYDLEKDPRELTNLVDTETEVCEQMKDRLKDLESSFVPATAQNLKLSESDHAKLMTLGYLSGTNSAVTEEDLNNAEKMRDVKDMLPLQEKYDRARLILTEGNLEEAITLLQQVVSETTEFPAAAYLLANCLADAHRLEDAKLMYRTVLSQRADFAVAHHKLGRIYSSQGDFENAVIEFSEYLQQIPDSAPDHYELGMALIQLQKTDQAIAEFREALQLAPEFVTANLALGQLLLSLHRPKEAIECFEHALQYDPKSANAHAYLFLALAQTQQFNQALVHANQAIALEPNSFEHRFNLGAFLINQRLFAEGISQLRVAQKLKPDDPRPAQLIRQVEASIK